MILQWWTNCRVENSRWVGCRCAEWVVCKHCSLDRSVRLESADVIYYGVDITKLVNKAVEGRRRGEPTQPWSEAPTHLITPQLAIDKVLVSSYTQPFTARSSAVRVDDRVEYSSNVIATESSRVRSLIGWAAVVSMKSRRVLCAVWATVDWWWWIEVLDDEWSDREDESVNVYLGIYFCMDL